MKTTYVLKQDLRPIIRLEYLLLAHGSVQINENCLAMSVIHNQTEAVATFLIWQNILAHVHKFSINCNKLQTEVTFSFLDLGPRVAY